MHTTTAARRNPHYEDYEALKNMALEVMAYEDANSVGRNEAIDACRPGADDQLRYAINDVIGSLQSHIAMKLAGLL